MGLTRAGEGGGGSGGEVLDPWPYGESFQRFQNLTNSITLISQALNLPEKLAFLTEYLEDNLVF